MGRGPGRRGEGDCGHVRRGGKNNDEGGGKHRGKDQGASKKPVNCVRHNQAPPSLLRAGPAPLSRPSCATCGPGGPDEGPEIGGLGPRIHRHVERPGTEGSVAVGWCELVAPLRNGTARDLSTLVNGLAVSQPWPIRRRVVLPARTGREPRRSDSIGSHRLVAQDTTLSRWRHGFEPRWDYRFPPGAPMAILRAWRTISSTSPREAERRPLLFSMRRCGESAATNDIATRSPQVMSRWFSWPRPRAGSSVASGWRRRFTSGHGGRPTPTREVRQVGCFCPTSSAGNPPYR